MDIRTEVDRDRQKDRGTRALSCVGKLIAICSTYMKSAGRIENVEESVLKKKSFSSHSAHFLTSLLSVS